MDLSIGEMALRLAVAAALGGVIGLDRERAGKPAGLRTNMLVALGAALFTMVGVAALGEVAPRYPEAGGGSVGGVGPMVQLDASRVIAGIVGGVGFLGAGTIIQAQGSVRGVTTAAGIWVAAAIDVASGLGLYWMAGIATVIAMLVLLLGLLERLAGMKSRENRGNEADGEGRPGMRSAGGSASRMTGT